jgi:hypothetical protein
MKNTITRVYTETSVDAQPDTSWLGRFSDMAEAGCIIRIGEHAGRFLQDLGDDDELPNKCHEYRFFIPVYSNWEGESDAKKREYALHDWKRMEDLSKGEWCFVGVIAKAIVTSIPGTMQTLRSGGLWGIESDSGKYLDEVRTEQLQELRAELDAFGFGSRAIDYAFKKAEHVTK